MSDSPSTPRFDGLYRGPVERVTDTVSCVEYFRFYEDGLVVAVNATTDETPEEVAAWFHRDFDGAGRGDWIVDGDRISWRDVTRERRRTIEVDWTGRIEGDAMVLDSVSKKRTAREQRFEFIPIAS
jgi:hypothetical protein